MAKKNKSKNNKKSKQQWVEGSALNERQKAFIRSCPEQQYNDPTYVQNKLDSLSDSYDPEVGELESSLKTAFSKEQAMVIIKKLLIKARTDVDRNKNDRYGDGDQSLLIGKHQEPQRQILRNLYSTGGDIVNHLRDRSGYSTFSLCCITGNVIAVEQKLQEATSQERHSLMELRETSMRVPPLILTIALSKFKDVVSLCCNYEKKNMDHVGVFRTLIKYGARPDAKDVTGKTVCHWGAGSQATNETLQMTEMAIKAARTSAVFGHEVILNGLSKIEYNGIEGILGGFVPKTERRIFYPEAGSIVSHELSLKPENIFIEMNEIELQNKSQICILKKCEDSTNLVDVSDRLGSISLHEVIPYKRGDVAEFLCTHSSTCLDIAEGHGITPRQMMCTYQPKSNKACEVLQKFAARQVKKEKDEKIMKQVNEEVCLNCKEGKATHQCSKCCCVSYCCKQCQADHWRRQHKYDCAKMEKEGELELDFVPLAPSFRYHIAIKAGDNFNYASPSGVGANEKFWIKVECNGKDSDLLICDKSKTCLFVLSTGKTGHKKLLDILSNETTFFGRKSFFKAKFQDNGRCVVYPKTSTAKKW